MAYHLQQMDHDDLVNDVIKTALEADPDLKIVSEDGQTIETHKFIFSLYSATMASLLNDNHTHRDLVMMTLPMPGVVVKNLVTVLLTGKIFSAQQSDLLEVASLGKSLGMDTKGMQLGCKKTAGKANARQIGMKETTIRKTERKVSISLIEEKVTLEETNSNIEAMEVEDESTHATVIEDVAMHPKQEPLDDDVTPPNDTIPQDFLFLETNLDVDWDNTEGAIKKEDDLMENKEEITSKKTAIHKCSECEEKFKSLRALNKHLAQNHSITFSENETVEGSTKFRCTYCGKCFTQPGSMNRHIKKIHEGIVVADTKFRCEHCEKSFTQPGTMNRHVKKIHESVVVAEKIHENVEVAENIHENVEVTEKIHESVVVAEKIHLSVEVAEKIHENLVVAEQIHESIEVAEKIHESVVAEVKFRCEHCEKSFTQPGTLNRHVNVVHEGVRYICDKCEYAGKYPHYLKEHTEKFHTRP